MSRSPSSRSWRPSSTPRIPPALHPAIRCAAADRVWARGEVEVVRGQAVEVRERGIEPFQHQLLPLAVLRGCTDSTLARFFALHGELDGAAAFLFGTLNTRTIYEENRLLNLMAFAEGYHRTFHDRPAIDQQGHAALVTAMLEAIDPRYRTRYNNALRYANGQTQRERMRALIARAASVSPDLHDPGDVFRDELVDTRNRYNHLGEPGAHVLEPTDLHDRVESLVQVLEANILLDLGVDGAEVPRLMAQAHG